MARKTIITCDRCGVDGDAKDFATFQPPSSAQPGNTREGFFDLCRGCLGELMEFLKVKAEPAPTVELGEPKT